MVEAGAAEAAATENKLPLHYRRPAGRSDNAARKGGVPLVGQLLGVACPGAAADSGASSDGGQLVGFVSARGAVSYNRRPVLGSAQHRRVSEGVDDGDPLHRGVRARPRAGEGRAVGRARFDVVSVAETRVVGRQPGEAGSPGSLTSAGRPGMVLDPRDSGSTQAAVQGQTSRL